ncbi:hypothetical protein [Novacetimonas hansenii]
MLRTVINKYRQASSATGFPPSGCWPRRHPSRTYVPGIHTSGHACTRDAASTAHHTHTIAGHGFIPTMRPANSATDPPCPPDQTPWAKKDLMMRETHCTRAAWHLTHSRPEMLVDYFNPWTPMSRQVSMLTHRFSVVAALCEQVGADDELVVLRNALAFHLLRAATWWRIDFAAPRVAGMPTTRFMAHIHAHIDRVAEDESLFDVLTWQHHMRRGDMSHVMVLGTDPLCRGGTSILYGLDGQRRFRFALREDGAGRGVAWNATAHGDFVSTCLDARARHSMVETRNEALGEWEDARIEHARAAKYHMLHFRQDTSRPVIDRYIEVLGEMTRCRSRFGRFEFGNILNHIAFLLVRAAHERQVSVASVLREGTAQPINLRVANSIKKRARAYVAHGVDPLLQDGLDTMLDSVVSGYSLSGQVQESE